MQLSAIGNDHSDRTDISLGELLGNAAETPDLALVFLYDGKPVKPGYHVTEVKIGQFSALDCGANPEALAIRGGVEQREKLRFDRHQNPRETRNKGRSLQGLAACTSECIAGGWMGIQE
ncbi:hypothetical protein J2Y48_003909 [Mycoplana sp. BE70]|nr:hypothetical protein [Mycoplana sp. BE70]